MPPIYDIRRTLYDSPVTVHDARPGDAEAQEANRKSEREARDYADRHMSRPTEAEVRDDIERAEARDKDRM